MSDSPAEEKGRNSPSSWFWNAVFICVSYFVGFVLLEIHIAIVGHETLLHANIAKILISVAIVGVVCAMIAMYKLISDIRS